MPVLQAVASRMTAPVPLLFVLVSVLWGFREVFSWEICPCRRVVSPIDTQSSMLEASDSGDSSCWKQRPGGGGYQEGAQGNCNKETSAGPPGCSLCFIRRPFLRRAVLFQAECLPRSSATKRPPAWALVLVGSRGCQLCPGRHVSSPTWDLCLLSLPHVGTPVGQRGFC